MHLNMEREFFRVRDPDIGNGVSTENRIWIFALTKGCISFGLATIIRWTLLHLLLNALNNLVLEHHLAEHHRMLVQILTQCWRTDVGVIEQLRCVKGVSADDERFTMDMLFLTSFEVFDLN